MLGVGATRCVFLGIRGAGTAILLPNPRFLLISRRLMILVAARLISSTTPSLERISAAGFRNLVSRSEQTLCTTVLWLAQDRRVERQRII